MMRCAAAELVANLYADTDSTTTAITSVDLEQIADGQYCL
ncbi:hypothetical protein EBESD8_54750 [Rhodococcus aetherivorans]|nr:hypothetical protein EBESD8_54750 [Rhodococcus aetherivorans]